jgi:hypothetical protein
VIGVKVWVFRGEVFDTTEAPAATDGGGAPEAPRPQ